MNFIVISDVWKLVSLCVEYYFFTRDSWLPNNIYDESTSNFQINYLQLPVTSVRTLKVLGSPQLSLCQERKLGVTYNHLNRQNSKLSQNTQMFNKSLICIICNFCLKSKQILVHVAALDQMKRTQIKDHKRSMAPINVLNLWTTCI